MNRRLMSFIFLAGVLGWASGAHGFVVKIYADSGGNEPQIFDNGPGTVSLYVVVDYSTGLKGVEFSARLPQCFEGATWLSDTWVFPMTVGNSQTGVSIGWEECRVSSIHVLTINVLTQGQTKTCCWYPVLPNPANVYGVIQGADCVGSIISGFGSSSYVSNTEPGPPLVGNPSPPDGASNVSLDTHLNWTAESRVCEYCCIYNNVYFGTTPDPPRAADGDYTSYDPGLLRPNTTYYWKVRSSYYCCEHTGDAATGPQWSFTTTGGVPAAPTTWGRVKALYED